MEVVAEYFVLGGANITGVAAPALFVIGIHPRTHRRHNNPRRCPASLHGHTRQSPIRL